jgi:oxygen-dependent protoporphyrinogen oxidase
MGRIVEAIAAQLGDPVLTGCRALSLRQMLDGFEVEVQGREGRTILSGSDLVLAVPAYEAARLVDPFHVRLAGALKRIRYVSSATVSLAFAGADAAAAPAGGGFGFVVPRGERSRLLAFTWSSRKFDHRAPADRHLVRAFVGGSRHEELALLPDAALVRLVRDELAELLGLRADPLGAWLYRWPAGNPQFDVGHLDRVAEMERLAAETPGLHLAGSAYRGLGIPDCVKSAQAVVDRILGAP